MVKIYFAEVTYLVSQHRCKSVKCDDHALIAWAVLPFWAKEQAGVKKGGLCFLVLRVRGNKVGSL